MYDVCLPNNRRTRRRMSMQYMYITFYFHVPHESIPSIGRASRTTYPSAACRGWAHVDASSCFTQLPSLHVMLGACVGRAVAVLWPCGVVLCRMMLAAPLVGGGVGMAPLWRGHGSLWQAE